MDCTAAVTDFGAFAVLSEDRDGAVSLQPFARTGDPIGDPVAVGHGGHAEIAVARVFNDPNAPPDQWGKDNDVYGVVWHRQRDRGQQDVMLRWFAPDGSDLYGETKVDDDAGVNYEAQKPAIAMAADGTTTVAYESYAGDLDEDFAEIEACVMAVGADLCGAGGSQINPTDPGRQEDAVVDMVGPGEIVVAWLDYREGLLGRVLRGRRGALSSPFVLAPQTRADGSEVSVMAPALAAGPGFAWAVAWEEKRPDVPGTIQVRIGRDATPGRSFPADAGQFGQGVDPDVTVLPDGTLVVVWSQGAGDVLARRFDRSGSPMGSTRRLLADRPYTWVNAPRVTAGPDGELLLTWVAKTEDTQTGCYARWISPDQLSGEGEGEGEGACEGLCPGEAPFAGEQSGVCRGMKLVCNPATCLWESDPVGAGVANYEVVEGSCDGLDNDCDEQVDEGFDIGAGCAPPGDCLAGVLECAGPAATRCSTAPGGSQSPVELCDGLDNNCDGETDEGVDGCLHCDGHTAGPPCNGCPAGIVVPRGWICAPSGTFLMGSPATEAGRGDNETQHEVTLTYPFLVQAMEVTQTQWQALLGRTPSDFRAGGGSGCSVDPCDDRPVEMVTWREAAAYCNALSLSEGRERCYKARDGRDYTIADADSGAEPQWPAELACLGYRLPTEAEWERAARAGDGRATYNGDLDANDHGGPDPVLDSIAWYEGNSGNRTHPVAAKEANSWGVHDALGNVYEWCWDRWDGDDYRGGTATNPTGRDVGSDRIVRGGSWRVVRLGERAAFRWGYGSGSYGSDLGLRPVRSALAP